MGSGRLEVFRGLGFRLFEDGLSMTFCFIGVVLDKDFKRTRV